jgi:hypothetical protein
VDIYFVRRTSPLSAVVVPLTLKSVFGIVSYVDLRGGSALTWVGIPRGCVECFLLWRGCEICLGIVICDVE